MNTLDVKRMDLSKSYKHRYRGLITVSKVTRVDMRKMKGTCI
jgi:hypothetical protein